MLFSDIQKQLRDRADRVVFVVGTGVALGAVRGTDSEPWAGKVAGPAFHERAPYSPNNK